MLVNRTIISLLLAAAILLVGIPASASDVRGKASVPYKAGLFSSGADANIRQQAIEEAKLSAWKRYTSTFNPARLQSYKTVEQEILTQLDEYIIDVTVLDEELDKKSQLYTVSIRASVNEAALSARLNSGGSESSQQNNEGGLFSFIFVARQVESMKSFDTRRTEIRSNESELAARQSESFSGGTASVDESSNSMSKVTTGGSSLRKANEVMYRIHSASDIDAAMTEVLAGYGFEVAGYSDVVANCGGPSPDVIRREFSDSDEMTVATRKGAIDAARICEVGLFAVGTMDIGLNDVDPVTGNQRVFVSVRGQVWNIAGKLPRRVASVGPVQFAGLGPDADVAMRNALRLSAEQGAKVLIDQLNVKGLR